MRISDWSSDVCSSDLPHEGRDAAYCRKYVQAIRQMIHFTCHCRTQGSGETVTGAVTINDVSLGRAAPFRHACGKDLCTGQFRPAVQMLKSVDIVAFPEILFELVRCLLGARPFEGEAQDDSPGPDPGTQQSQHDHLHHDISLQDRKTAG